MPAELGLKEMGIDPNAPEMKSDEQRKKEQEKLKTYFNIEAKLFKTLYDEFMQKQKEGKKTFSDFEKLHLDGDLYKQEEPWSRILFTQDDQPMLLENKDKFEKPFAYQDINRMSVQKLKENNPNKTYFSARAEKIKIMFDTLVTTGIISKEESLNDYYIQKLRSNGLCDYKSNEKIDRMQVIYGNLNEAREREILGDKTIQDHTKDQQFMQVLKSSLETIKTQK